MRAKSTIEKIVFAGCVILLIVGASVAAAAQAKPAALDGQKGFATADAAADALIQAAANFDVPALEEVLGADGRDLIASGDLVQDKNRAAAFAAKANEKRSIARSTKNANWAVLSVGNEQWPLPIPLVRRGGKWYFDVAKGRETILYRRIGANELDAITICRGYVEAQRQYSMQAHDGVAQYAQRIISTPGQQDGLVWRNADGTLGGPISEPIAKAIEQGYTDKTQPYHGYYFKVLKGQGPAARLGQLDFVIKGVMIGGFALVAAPADYRASGVKTFIVSHDGVVYQKDLGPDTAKLFQEMELYNPDKTWKPTDDDWPAGAVLASN